MSSKTLKTIQILDKRIIYETDYRKVKHPRLEFKTGNLLLIIPKNWHEREQDLIQKHKRWIYKKHKQILSALKEGKQKKLVHNRDNNLFKDYVREKMNSYLNRLNLQANRIRFRIMRTKWASCSSARNISINALLRYLPDDTIDYVLFHEIAHLKEWKHSKRFWNIVEKEFKDTEKKEKDLMTFWFLIQKKL